jgi:hypothetical protein
LLDAAEQSMDSEARGRWQQFFDSLHLKFKHKILTGCGGSVSLLVRPRFTLLYFTLL